MNDHDESDWGPWLASGLPAIGDYVQLDCYDYNDADRRHRVEGTVTMITSCTVILDPDPGPTFWIATRYRVRKPRGLRQLNAILRRVERTHRPRKGRAGHPTREDA